MRKTLLVLLATLVISVPSVAQATLVVTIKNIHAVKGSIRVALFDNKQDFPEQPVAGKVASVSDYTATVVFENVKPGYYAISAIHDENDNDQLDTNAIGIPKEGFAFGNNALGAFGPPAFKKAGVTLTAGHSLTQVLTLKYF